MTQSIQPDVNNTKTPQFLIKLYEILESKEYHDIICWSDEGDSFILRNISNFSDKILAKYFKHQNFSSFVRQLNMYDFHKVKHSNNEQCFEHPCFRKNYMNLLRYIKRKSTKGKKTKRSSKRKNDLFQPASYIIPIDDINLKFKKLEKNFEDLSVEVKYLKTENDKLKDNLREKEKLIETIISYLGKNYKTDCDKICRDNLKSQLDSSVILLAQIQQLANLFNFNQNFNTFVTPNPLQNSPKPNNENSPSFTPVAEQSTSLVDLSNSMKRDSTTSGFYCNIKEEVEEFCFLKHKHYKS